MTYNQSEISKALRKNKKPELVKVHKEEKPITQVRKRIMSEGGYIKRNA